LSEIRDNWAAVQARNVVVYGVNPFSQESHRRFAAKHQFPFTLISDQGGTLARRYHAGGRIVRRTVYLIGPDRRILFARRGLPSSSEVLVHLPA
jgi:thioredoxin-dependent peroxiredoxin